MPRLTLTPNQAPGPYDTDGADLAFAAGDPANNHQVLLTGREMLIARNTDAGAPHQVTVLSTPLSKRTGDAVKSVPANGFAVFQIFPTDGWVQSDGNLYIDVDDAQLELAIVKLP